MVLVLVLALVALAAPARADEAAKGGTGAKVAAPQGKPKFGEPAVWIDGVPLAVMRFHELPPAVKTRWKTLDDGRKVRRFSLGQYLRALGVDLGQVKEIHFYGGRRAHAVKAADFRRFADKLQFSFSQSTQGQPRLHWPSGTYKGRGSIEMLGSVAIYVHKTPPVWSVEDSAMRLDGKPVDGIPYATVEGRGGTRVYLDGRLRATIKRNSLGAEHMVAGSSDRGDPQWELAPVLKAQGFELDTAKSCDLGAEGAAKATRVEVESLLSGTFSAVPQSSGMVLLHPQEAKVSAVMCYRKQTPPDLAAR